MKKPGSLLVAGPAAIDDLPGRANTIGGGAAYAAIAAAPLANTQLWTHLGTGYDHQILGVLERRRIDLAGVELEGESNHFAAATGEWTVCAAILPEAEPVEAGDLNTALLAHLPPAETDRVITVLESLDVDLLRLAAPRPSDVKADPGYLLRTAERVDLLITDLGTASAATGEEDPAAISAALQQGRCSTVLLTAGALGGILCYKQKRCTWPSLVVERSADSLGIGATFAGVVAGSIAASGHLDFRGLKRTVLMASAVAGSTLRGPGPTRLLGLNGADYQTAFLKLRRNGKT